MTTKTIGFAPIAKRPINVQPDQIRRKPGFNPRFDFGDLSEIKGSMKVEGFHAHKPLLVQRTGDKLKDGRDIYELVDGDRRFTSVEELVKEGFKFTDGIPVCVADKALTDLDLRVMAYTSNTGKPFLPLEEAALIKTMRDVDGLTVKEIAKRLSKFERQVYAALALVDADDSVKEAVATGKVGVTLARDIAEKAKGDKKKQKELVEKASKGGRAKDAVRDEVKRIQGVQSRRRLNQPEKVKPLGQAQLDEQQAKLYEQFVEAASAEGLGDVDAMLAACAKDGRLSAAFYLGAYLATQAARGEKVKISL